MGAWSSSDHRGDGAGPMTVGLAFTPWVTDVEIAARAVDATTATMSLRNHGGRRRDPEHQLLHRGGHPSHHPKPRTTMTRKGTAPRSTAKGDVLNPAPCVQQQCRMHRREFMPTAATRSHRQRPSAGRRPSSSLCKLVVVAMSATLHTCTAVMYFDSWHDLLLPREGVEPKYRIAYSNASSTMSRHRHPSRKTRAP